MVAKCPPNNQATNSQDWLTPREVAAYLRTGLDLVSDACATGCLKHVRLGHRTIRVRRAWVDARTEAKATESGYPMCRMGTRPFFHRKVMGFPQARFGGPPGPARRTATVQ
jgi:excisionase family DNA binding protein